MFRTHNKKKRRLLLLIPLFLLLAAVGLAAILRPDYRYLAIEAVSMIGSHASPEKMDSSALSLAQYPMDTLLKDSRVSFDQSLMLINSSHPLDSSFEPQTGQYKDTDVMMNTCMLTSFERLSARVKEQFDETLYIRSAFRTAEEQEAEFLANSDLAARINASEHQAGLALDVYVKYYAGRGFLKTETGQYVNSNCWKYGFIIRYPYYGERETGVPYEPWHIRYVGAPHAELIYKNQTTLESYIDSLEPGSYYQYDHYVITRQSGTILQLPAEFSSAVILPDNLGNYIITVK